MIQKKKKKKTINKSNPNGFWYISCENMQLKIFDI